MAEIAPERGGVSTRQERISTGKLVAREPEMLHVRSGPVHPRSHRAKAEFPVYQFTEQTCPCLPVLLQLTVNAAKKCRLHAPRGNDAHERVA